MALREQHCFNCGEPLGRFDARMNEIDVLNCGKAECVSEMRYQYACERDERMRDAFDDDFQRY